MKLETIVSLPADALHPIRSKMGLEGRKLTSSNQAVRISAVIGFLGVALGAFGAHGLEPRLEANGTGEVWKTAVLYHLVHAVMLFLVATRANFHRGAWISFLLGILLFSGSLYVLALTNLTWLGAVTPFGGLSLLAGWGWLIWRPSSGTGS